jgi:Cu2+-exporting ATPase
MTPSTASEISRSTADLVFLRESLMAVPTVIDVAKRARALIVQNLIFAAGYNLIAIPFAALGYVSPLVAAVAMSSSSLLVTLNAIRLSR